MKSGEKAEYSDSQEARAAEKLHRKNLTHKTATTAKRAISKEDQKKNEEPVRNGEQEPGQSGGGRIKPKNQNNSKAQNPRTRKWKSRSKQQNRNTG